jgi:hypothetical protein
VARWRGREPGGNVRGRLVLTIRSASAATRRMKAASAYSMCRLHESMPAATTSLRRLTELTWRSGSSPSLPT